jgi:hypothetical protein
MTDSCGDPLSAADRVLRDLQGELDAARARLADARDAAPLPMSKGTPLPLSDRTGTPTTHAAYLRRQGLSYSAIAIVMREYHGVYWAAHTWRRRVVDAGLVTAIRTSGRRQGAFPAQAVRRGAT